MTLEVHAAINECGAYRGRRTFLDPEWVYRLSGKFSTLYFESLAGGDDGSRAWKIAYCVAKQRRSTAVENAVLGINAHINFDLPRAIARNLSWRDRHDYSIMQKRKFDHDQVNNLLAYTVDPIERILAEDYEPGVAVADRFLGGLDERLSETELKFYRERVWWDALAYAAAEADGDAGVVRAKLDWESYELARVLLNRKLLWRSERALNSVVSLFSRKSWTKITIEDLGGVDAVRRSPINLRGPNPRRRRRDRDDCMDIGPAAVVAVPGPPMGVNLPPMAAGAEIRVTPL
jgi:hypothetical protein